MGWGLRCSCAAVLLVAVACESGHVEPVPEGADAGRPDSGTPAVAGRGLGDRFPDPCTAWVDERFDHPPSSAAGWIVDTSSNATLTFGSNAQLGRGLLAEVSFPGDPLVGHAMIMREFEGVTSVAMRYSLAIGTVDNAMVAAAGCWVSFEARDGVGDAGAQNDLVFFMVDSGVVQFEVSGPAPTKVVVAGQPVLDRWIDVELLVQSLANDQGRASLTYDGRQYALDFTIGLAGRPAATRIGCGILSAPAPARVAGGKVAIGVADLVAKTCGP